MKINPSIYPRPVIRAVLRIVRTFTGKEPPQAVLKMKFGRGEGCYRFTENYITVRMAQSFPATIAGVNVVSWEELVAIAVTDATLFIFQSKLQWTNAERRENIRKTIEHLRSPEGQAALVCARAQHDEDAIRREQAEALNRFPGGEDVKRLIKQQRAIRTKLKTWRRKLRLAQTKTEHYIRRWNRITLKITGKASAAS